MNMLTIRDFDGRALFVTGLPMETQYFTQEG